MEGGKNAGESRTDASGVEFVRPSRRGFLLGSAGVAFGGASGLSLLEACGQAAPTASTSSGAAGPPVTIRLGHHHPPGVKGG
jgi:hypothetical protein